MYRIVSIEEVIGSVFVCEQDVREISSKRVYKILCKLHEEDHGISVDFTPESFARVEYLGQDIMSIRKGKFCFRRNSIVTNRFKKCYFSTDPEIRDLLISIVNKIK